MTVTLIPDAEMLVGAYLRDHPDVAALGVRVAGTTPSSQAMAWTRLTQLDARPIDDVEHLIDFLLQLDCYAGNEAMRAHTGQAEAWLSARTVRAALKALAPSSPGFQGQMLTGVAVTDVSFTSMARIPDQGFEPARERVVLDVSIYVHA